MIELNPEFFTIKQLKEMSMWDTYTFLSAYGMLPYLKRMKKENLIGIEIGVLKGENVYTLLKECSNISKIYGVDFYKEHTDYDNKRTQEDMERYLSVANENLKEFEDRYELLKLSSSEAVKFFEEKSVDFILVDGDHSEEGIYNDLKNYYPVLRDGGYIFIHDNNAFSVMDGIKRFRNEFKVRIPVNMSKNFISFWVKK